MITVIVPTYQEHDNVVPLVEELWAARPQSAAMRILFVDDSPDRRTVEAVEEAGRRYHSDVFGVDHIHREGTELVGGLAGAVVRGMNSCQGNIVAVMDGDGQHPPAVIAALYSKLLRTEADIVVASRYRRGGSSEGLDGTVRHLASRSATWIAKTLFPHELRGVTDPMSGCFMIRSKERVDPGRLRPEGFKILLEILVAHPELRRTEVPLRFRARKAGESKGTTRLAVIYLRQLWKLRLTLNDFRKKVTS